MKEKLYSAVIVLAGLFCMLWVQYFLRPGYHNPDLVRLLLGCFPNFISAIIIPYTGFLLLNKKFNFYSLFTQDMVHVTTCLFLISYELLQLVPAFGKTFDYFDITATVAGTIISSLYMQVLIKTPSVATVPSVN